MDRRRFAVVSALMLQIGMSGAAAGSLSPTNDVFVRVSPRDSRYFELSDGRPYIPIGLNMIAPPAGEGLSGMETWMKYLEANGGSFICVWLLKFSKSITMRPVICQPAE